jgi:hypothetical protein
MNIEERKELAKEVCKGVDRVWDAIGMDCLQLSPNGEMSAAEVVELSIDADRLVAYEEHDAEAAWELLSPEFDSYAEQLEFVASQMPFKIYGY